MSVITRPTSVYAESTPNPSAMKFVANRMLIQGPSLEYQSREKAKSSPLAMSLFDFPFVSSVFIAGNFVTITKNQLVEWTDVTTEMREFIREYVSSEKAIVTEIEKPESNTESNNKETIDWGFNVEPKNEIEEKIISILEEYIRPAVEQDGGNISFQSFEDGRVNLMLHGSCSGCPSSTLTLKSGIEGLLKRMVPEVKEVFAVEDNR